MVTTPCVPHHTNQFEPSNLGSLFTASYTIASATGSDHRESERLSLIQLLVWLLEHPR